MITLPTLKTWLARQIVTPADMNGQVYDVHNALYTVVADHENQINKNRMQPMMSVTLQNPIVLGANGQQPVFWNTSVPLARVGTWPTTDGATIKVPETGIYRFTMSYGGWSTGTSTGKFRAWIVGPTASAHSYMYPDPNGGDTKTNSFTFALPMNANDAFTAYAVAWWQPFRSDTGSGTDERYAWNLTVEKISSLT